MENPDASASPTRLDAARFAVASIAVWPPRRWLIAAAAAAVAALVMGTPTGIIRTSLYTRMTAVTWWDYPIWAISSLLFGLMAATYVRTGVGGSEPRAPDPSRRTISAALLSTLAVGCPICNKLVVALIGVSGALSYWAPLQPVLGLLSIALLLTGLAIRLSGQVACPSPAR